MVQDGRVDNELLRSDLNSENTENKYVSDCPADFALLPT
jgi:hypothetical protein